MSEHPPPQEAHWPDGAIFTLGHSTLAIESVMPVLQVYGIERLVDIRTIPRSRHNPQFNETALAESLKAPHLEYVHLKALGGLRHPRKDSPNTGWRNEGFSRLCRLYANRGVSGRARGAHSHEPPKARWDHVRRSGALAMPPFAGGRCAQRAWCTGRRDFIGEQLPDASAHTVRASGGPANYLSTRASFIAVSFVRSRGAVERALAAVSPAMRRWPGRSSTCRRHQRAGAAARYAIRSIPMLILVHARAARLFGALGRATPAASFPGRSPFEHSA